MKNCLNNENVKVNPGFTLTSRIIGQGAFEKTDAAASSIQNYVSTADQTTVATKQQNNAIRNLSLAGFALRNSSVLAQYNLAVKKEKITA